MFPPKSVISLVSPLQRCVSQLSLPFAPSISSFDNHAYNLPSRIKFFPCLIDFRTVGVDVASSRESVLCKQVWGIFLHLFFPSVVTQVSQRKWNFPSPISVPLSAKLRGQVIASFRCISSLFPPVLLRSFLSNNTLYSWRVAEAKRTFLRIASALNLLPVIATALLIPPPLR